MKTISKQYKNKKDIKKSLKCPNNSALFKKKLTNLNILLKKDKSSELNNHSSSEEKDNNNLYNFKEKFLCGLSAKQYIKTITQNAKKSLGQNFLIDANIIQKICLSLKEYANYCIFEIGPGPGIMTSCLRETFNKSLIFAIEKDNTFIENLNKIPQTTVFNGDILNFDWNEFWNQLYDYHKNQHINQNTTTHLDSITNQHINCANFPYATQNISKHFHQISLFINKKYNDGKTLQTKSNLNSQICINFQSTIIAQSVIIGNLPYNISVPILFSILEKKSLFKCAVFMFQKEVADRILSQENSPHYGKLSIMAQCQAHVERIMNINPTVFWPKPKITSSVLRFTFHEEDLFDKVATYYAKNLIKSHANADQNEYCVQIKQNHKNSKTNDDNPQNSYKTLNFQRSDKELYDFGEFIISKSEWYAELDKLTSIFFQQRRKMLREIMKNAVSRGDYAQHIETVLSKCNINLTARPENLSPFQFVHLSLAIFDFNITNHS